MIKVNPTQRFTRGLAMGLSLLAFAVLALANGCQQKESSQEGGMTTYAEGTKLKQYMQQGQKLYAQRCVQCHKQDGSGMAKLYPPLKDADYLAADVNRTVCLIRNGVSGSITVNGTEYNMAMPANKDLKPLDIALITTYIYNTFTPKEDFLITDQEVRKQLEACGQYSE